MCCVEEAWTDVCMLTITGMYILSGKRKVTIVLMFHYEIDVTALRKGSEIMTLSV